MTDLPASDRAAVSPADIVAPNPADLVESMRGMGYTTEEALADLIDNSLTAGSRNIQITVAAAESMPHIAVCDNGCGMTAEVLTEAMRMGTMGPLASRQSGDLGRFGLGLKTASLSQGRCVTVMSRSKGQSVEIRCWDLDHIRQTKNWSLRRTPGPAAAEYLEQLEDQPHGTCVIIEDLDRGGLPGVGTRSTDKHVSKLLGRIRSHLSMVFHRFIGQGIVIRLGQSNVPAWDPFLRQHSTLSGSERLSLSSGGEAAVESWVLPHQSRITAEEYESAAGPLGWGRHQGFYIYRCDRLIVPGTWLGLFRKTEQTRLARICIDLTNDSDEAWQLDVMKSHVVVPTELRDEVFRIGQATQNAALKVYSYRGEREAPSAGNGEQQTFDAVWRRSDAGGRIQYRINRRHPIVAAVLDNGRARPANIESAIRIIESAIPVAAILQDPAKALESGRDEPNAEELETLAEAAAFSIQHAMRRGRTRDEAIDGTLRCHPFCLIRKQLRERLTPGG